MPKKRLQRYLSLVFDKTAARRMEEEAEASLERAGKIGSKALEQEMGQGGRKAARALTKELEREYKARIARAKHQLADGLIDESEFKREGNRAALAFNKGLSAGLKQLDGKLSATEATALASRFKMANAVPAAGGLLSTLSGKLFAAGGALFAADKIQDTVAEMFRLGTAAQETGSKFQTTFGPASEQMDAFLEKWGTLAGLDETVGRDFAATIATIGQGMGFAQRESADFSERVLRLAGDLQSFHNVPIEETFAAIKSGLAGEVEPMRRFGVMLSAAKVQQEAMRETGKTLASSLTDQEKALASLTLMYQGAGPAVGDLERTQHSTANEARQLAAEFQNIRIEIAANLLPVFQQTIGFLHDHNEEIKSFGHFAAEFIRVGAENWLETWRQIAAVYERAAKAAEHYRNALHPRDALHDDALNVEGARLSDPTNPRLLIDGITITAPPRRTTPPPPPPTPPAGPPPAAAPLPQPRIGVVSPGPDTTPDNLTGVGVLGVTPQDVSAFDAMLAGVMENAAGYGQEAAYEMSSAFQDAFSQMMEEGATFGSFMEALGKGMAGAVLAGIAQIASAKSAEMFARAIEAGATALLTGNPAAAASIPEWIAAGTAYAALAGLAGAARGAVTGGAGAIPPSTRDAGLGVAQGAERQGPEVHIYIDPLDPARPAVQRVVYRANQLGEERFNGAEVHVHPAQRGAA